MEDALEERPVGAAGEATPFDLVDPPRGPGVDRRIDVRERPLVGRQLPVRVHVPLAGEQDQLPLGEFRIDERERDGVEREVPGREPRVLPRVSGMEMMSAVLSGRHSELRPCSRSGGGVGRPGSPSSQWPTS